MKQIILTLVILAISIFSINGLERFDGSTVYEIELKTEEQVKMVLRMQELRQIDVWSDNVSLGPVDIRVPAEMKEKFSKIFFEQEKCAKKVQIEDLQKLIDVELLETSKRAIYTNYLNKSQTNDFFNAYRRLSEIETWTKDRVKLHPTLSSIFTIGKSHEGRDQLGIKITGPGDASKRPALFFHGAIHAREWVSPTTVLWIINELLEKYKTNPKVKHLVDNIVWYIIPVANPDGYEYTHIRDRMWRKTRSPNQGSTCVGVDPNRNFEYKWNTGGSDSNPCSDAYHGPSPLSAVETRNIANYGRKIPNLKGYIDFHAYSQLYMRPWGWSREEPKDEALLKRFGDAAATAISGTHRYTYRSGRIAIIIYIASGSSADYFYGNMGIPSFGIELRPASAFGGGFVLPPAQIIPTGQENFEGVKILGEMILERWTEENTPKSK